MSRVPNSTAVMARRRAATKAPKGLPGPEALDIFPTPPWATRALIERVLMPEIFRGEPLHILRERVVWEPSCGKGHMAIPLAEYFGHVRATDVHDWGYGDRRDLDFLSVPASLPGDFPAAGVDRPHWIIMNPPFVLAEQFVAKALRIATEGVAVFLRLAFVEGEERYENVWSPFAHRPRLVAPFAERVPIIEEVWDPEASSATAYAWFVFLTKQPAPADQATIPMMLIPPGMEKRFTLLSDRPLMSPGEAKRRKLAREAAADGAAP